MSSRPPPPIQPDPKRRLYGASAAPSHAMAATQFPMAGPRALPLPSVLASPNTRLPPPLEIQSPYKSPSLQIQPGHAAAFPAQRQSLYPPLHPYSQPAPQQAHARPQGAAPLDRLLHTQMHFSSGSPSPTSPSYPSHNQARLPFEENPTQDYYETQRLPYQREGGYRTSQVSPASYQYPRTSMSSNHPSTPSAAGLSTPLVHLPRPPERRPKPQDITDRYNLRIRQQPIAARACGFGERDRRVIDPPPIVQLSLTDFDPNSSADVSELRWPFNVVHCALLSVSSQSPGSSSHEDVTTITDPNNANRQSRRLMGTLVASPFIGTDPEAPSSGDSNARLGCFFIFPDLSCRQNGVYRLRFTLMKVNVEMIPTGGRSSMVGTVESDIFEVFSAKDFPGMRASTALTKELKRQGATVSVKKGNEAKAGKKMKKRGSTTSDRSASDESDSGTASKTSSKKKSKD